MSTVMVWESGLTCDGDGCGQEFRLGEEIIYWYGRKLHQSCASADAASRRDAAGDGDALGLAHRLLDSGSRVVLTRRQLRALIGLATAGGLEPVRKPDTGRHQWYGRMHGWAAERVRAGLSAPEVTGLWLDFLDAGRIPPLRARDLAVLVEAIGSRDASVIVTAP